MLRPGTQSIFSIFTRLLVVFGPLPNNQSSKDWYIAQQLYHYVKALTLTLTFLSRRFN